MKTLSKQNVNEGRVRTLFFAKWQWENGTLELQDWIDGWEGMKCDDGEWWVEPDVKLNRRGAKWVMEVGVYGYKGEKYRVRVFWVEREDWRDMDVEVRIEADEWEGLGVLMTWLLEVK